MFSLCSSSGVFCPRRNSWIRHWKGGSKKSATLLHHFSHQGSCNQCWLCFQATSWELTYMCTERSHTTHQRIKLSIKDVDSPYWVSFSASSSLLSYKMISSLLPWFRRICDGGISNRNNYAWGYVISTPLELISGRILADPIHFEQNVSERKGDEN